MPLRALDDWGSDFPALKSLLAAWAIHTTGYLNRILPKDTYRTYPDIISGFRIGTELPDHEGPPPTASGIAVLEDVCEVHVMQPGEQLRPVGVVIFVTPTAKTDCGTTLLWTSLSYLRRGIPLVLVDITDAGEQTIHDGLAPFLDVEPLGTRLSVVGYRPTRRGVEHETDVWAYGVATGQIIPSVPLALRGGPTIVLDLEATYTAAIEATGL